MNIIIYGPKNKKITEVPCHNNPESPIEDLFPDTSVTGIYIALCFYLMVGILDHIVFLTNLYDTRKDLNLNIIYISMIIIIKNNKNKLFKLLKPLINYLNNKYQQVYCGKLITY